jgi:hypothetical protein
MGGGHSPIGGRFDLVVYRIELSASAFRTLGDEFPSLELLALLAMIGA